MNGRPAALSSSPPPEGGALFLIPVSIRKAEKMDEPTPWEEINPTTALVRPPEPRNQFSVPWYEKELEPATKADFRRELTACLALVAPSGMATEARREWLLVAWGTLRDTPTDLLKRGCEHARRVADHPAKIVPAVMDEIRETWDYRRTRRSEIIADQHRMTALPPPRETPCTPEQAAEIMAEMGLSSEAKETARKALGPRRTPTRQDYLDMGVAPDVLDQLTASKEGART
jgi:hypothetical protein